MRGTARRTSRWRLKTAIPHGAYADGTYLYVVDKTDRKIYAYNHATGAHDTSKEITLHADNADASGLAKSAANFYVVDGTDDKIYAYGTDGTRAAGKDSTGSIAGDPQGLTIAGGYLRVLSYQKIFAYPLAAARKRSRSGLPSVTM